MKPAVPEITPITVSPSSAILIFPVRPSVDTVCPIRSSLLGLPSDHSKYSAKSKAWFALILPSAAILPLVVLKRCLNLRLLEPVSIS